MAMHKETRILYGAPGSVFVRKPRILLQEKDLKFSSDPVNPMSEVSDEFKSISPLQKIPVLRDGNYVIADSSCICAYLDKKYPSPSFYPSDAKFLGQALWFEEYGDTVLFKAIAPIYYQTVLSPLYRQRKTNHELINVALDHDLPPVADYLNSHVDGKKYLVANQFSIADVTIASIFLNMYLSGYALPASRWPHLAAYLENHFQRASFVSCINDVQIEFDKAQKIFQ